MDPRTAPPMASPQPLHTAPIDYRRARSSTDNVSLRVRSRSEFGGDVGGGSLDETASAVTDGRRGRRSNWSPPNTHNHNTHANSPPSTTTTTTTKATASTAATKASPASPTVAGEDDDLNTAAILEDATDLSYELVEVEEAAVPWSPVGSPFASPRQSPEPAGESSTTALARRSTRPPATTTTSTTTTTTEPDGTAAIVHTTSSSPRRTSSPLVSPSKRNYRARRRRHGENGDGSTSPEASFEHDSPTDAVVETFEDHTTLTATPATTTTTTAPPTCNHPGGDSDPLPEDRSRVKRRGRKRSRGAASSESGDGADASVVGSVGAGARRVSTLGQLPPPERRESKRARKTPGRWWRTIPSPRLKRGPSAWDAKLERAVTLREQLVSPEELAVLRTPKRGRRQVKAAAGCHDSRLSMAQTGGRASSTTPSSPHSSSPNSSSSSPHSDSGNSQDRSLSPSASGTASASVSPTNSQERADELLCGSPQSRSRSLSRTPSLSPSRSHSLSPGDPSGSPLRSPGVSPGGSPVGDSRSSLSSSRSPSPVRGRQRSPQPTDARGGRGQVPLCSLVRAFAGGLLPTRTLPGFA